MSFWMNKLKMSQMKMINSTHYIKTFLKVHPLKFSEYEKTDKKSRNRMGNLREYYTNYKSRFDCRLKLRMSLDIACGLILLRTVKVNYKISFDCLTPLFKKK